MRDQFEIININYRSPSIIGGITILVLLDAVFIYGIIAGIINQTIGNAMAILSMIIIVILIFIFTINSNSIIIKNDGTVIIRQGRRTYRYSINEVMICRAEKGITIKHASGEVTLNTNDLSIKMLEGILNKPLEVCG